MFHHCEGARLGVIQGGKLIDVSQLDYQTATSLAELVLGGSTASQALEAAISSAPESAKLSIDDVLPALPIAKPEKFICVGLNYALHAKEGGHDIPSYPSFFLRVPSSLVAAGSDVVRPKCSEQLDYECELAVVIGKRGRHIDEARALDHVFGYTLFNDVSLRDYQRKTAQWTAGKNFDATGPLGPHVVTADELPPGASGLSIRTRVNGKVMQDSNTRDMIFPVAQIISILSEFMTLAPGDIIATGTPSGVAHARTPPAWLKPGDTVEVEIEKIGVLQNSIVNEINNH